MALGAEALRRALTRRQAPHHQDGVPRTRVPTRLISGIHKQPSETSQTSETGGPVDGAVRSGKGPVGPCTRPRPTRSLAGRPAAQQEIIHRAPLGEPLEALMITIPWRRSRKREASVLVLARARRTVGVEAVLQLPTVMMLVVEDACTALAREDWKRREPSRRHPRARRHWRAEGCRLREKEERLRELAVECLDARH